MATLSTYAHPQHLTIPAPLKMEFGEGGDPRIPFIVPFSLGRLMESGDRVPTPSPRFGDTPTHQPCATTAGDGPPGALRGRARAGPALGALGLGDSG